MSPYLTLKPVIFALLVILAPASLFAFGLPVFDAKATEKTLQALQAERNAFAHQRTAIDIFMSASFSQFTTEEFIKNASLIKACQRYDTANKEISKTLALVKVALVRLNETQAALQEMDSREAEIYLDPSDTASVATRMEALKKEETQLKEELKKLPGIASNALNSVSLLKKQEAAALQQMIQLSQNAFPGIHIASILTPPSSSTSLLAFDATAFDATAFDAKMAEKTLKALQAERDTFAPQREALDIFMFASFSKFTVEESNKNASLIITSQAYDTANKAIAKALHILKENLIKIKKTQTGLKEIVLREAEIYFTPFDEPSIETRLDALKEEETALNEGLTNLSSAVKAELEKIPQLKQQEADALEEMIALSLDAFASIDIHAILKLPPSTP